MYGHNRHSPVDDDLAREDVEIRAEVDHVVERGARVAPAGRETERAVERIVDAEVADRSGGRARHDGFEAGGVVEGSSSRPTAGGGKPVRSAQYEDPGLEYRGVAARAYQRAAARFG